MDDIAEQHDISREITDAISNNVAFANDVDDEELEKELEELEQVCDLTIILLIDFSELEIYVCRYV